MKIQKKKFWGRGGVGLGGGGGCERRIEVFVRTWGGVGGQDRGGGRGQGRYEWRSEVFVIIPKNVFLGGGGVGTGGREGEGGGGQDGCELRIEVFVKIKKNVCFFLGGGGRVCEVGWGVRMDENEGLKFL